MNVHDFSLILILPGYGTGVASQLFKTRYIWRKLEEEDECNDSNEQQNEERDHVANIRGGPHTNTQSTEEEF